MKIVMVSTLWERTPPSKYGGTERVVHNLTEELVKRGHNVTLFATGDSVTKAKLKSVYPRALYRDGVNWGNPYWPLINLSRAFQYAEEIKADIVHQHCQYLGYVIAPLSKIPVVSTHHGNLYSDTIKKEKSAMLKLFKNNDYISISHSQRKPVPFLNWRATVYNGVDTESFDFEPKPGKYLAWLARFTPSKGPKEAILIAKKVGMSLVMAGKIEKNAPSDLKYYESEIKPLIDGKQIKYIGELNHRRKNKLLKNAYCLINPINWAEPFGLVPVEANACGCPVVTFSLGAMAEIIKDGVNGFAVKPGDLGAVANAIKKCEQIDRISCRRYAEDNFSIARMTDQYLKIYEKIIQNKPTKGNE